MTKSKESYYRLSEDCKEKYICLSSDERKNAVRPTQADGRIPGNSPDCRKTGIRTTVIAATTVLAAPPVIAPSPAPSAPHAISTNLVISTAGRNLSHPIPCQQPKHRHYHHLHHFHHPMSFRPKGKISNSPCKRILG